MTQSDSRHRNRVVVATESAHQYQGIEINWITVLDCEHHAGIDCLQLQSGIQSYDCSPPICPRVADQKTAVEVAELFC